MFDRFRDVSETLLKTSWTMWTAPWQAMKDGAEGGWSEQLKQLQQSWDQAAQSWWSDYLRQPETLAQMGKSLNGLCEQKERWDRMAEDHWGRMRLASAGDLERLHARIGELEDTILRLEDALQQQQAPVLTAAQN